MNWSGALKRRARNLSAGNRSPRARCSLGSAGQCGFMGSRLTDGTSKTCRSKPWVRFEFVPPFGWNARFTSVRADDAFLYPLNATIGKICL